MDDKKPKKLKATKHVSQQKSVKDYPALNKKLNVAASKYTRPDTPLAVTPEPALIDETYVRKNSLNN